MDLKSLFEPRKPAVLKPKKTVLEQGEFYINVTFGPSENVTAHLGTVYHHKPDAEQRKRIRFNAEAESYGIGPVVTVHPSTHVIVVHVPKNKTAWVKHVIFGQETKCHDKSDTSTPTS
jgi:hypothetical protein